VWVWTAATLALVVVAALLWRGSDARATSSTTSAATEALTGTPDADLAVTWSADSGPTPGQVVEDGRVVVGSEHGLRALDPLTGAEVWHYTRSNAELCGLAATSGVVVAVFRTDRRCDEVVSLRAATGVYAWTRNLMLRPDATLAAASNTVLATSPTGVLTLDPLNDNVRWRAHASDGCLFEGTAVGTSGVLVLQRCTGNQALTLRLLDLGDGRAVWSRDVDVPAGAAAELTGGDRLVSLLAGQQLQLFSATDGTPLPAQTVPAGDPGLLQTVAGDTVLVWARGTAYAVDPSTGALRWSVPALGLPAAGAAGTSTLGLGSVLVPEDGALVRRDVVTGAEQARSAVTGTLPAGGSAEVDGPAVVYRLPDRVIGLS
jgi:outer membrane protein assembly factor BamB